MNLLFQPTADVRHQLPYSVYRELTVRVELLKRRLQQRYELLLPGHSALIRRLISEAEQAAWETSFPHLLLPDLAEVRLNALATEHVPALAMAA